MTLERANADTRVTDAILIHILNLPISSLSAWISSKYSPYAGQIWKCSSIQTHDRVWKAKGEEIIKNWGCRRHLATESDKVSYSNAYDKDTSLMSWVIADMSLCGRHLSLHTNKWVSFSQLLYLTNTDPSCWDLPFSQWNSLWPKCPLRNCHRDDGNKTFRYL